MKKIHVLLSKKSFEELRNIKREIGLDAYKVECFDINSLPETYEEYLKQEEANPTMALFG